MLAHVGLPFGVANQIVLAALAIGPLCLIFWGYLRHRHPRAGDDALISGPWTPPPVPGTRREPDGG